MTPDPTDPPPLPAPVAARAQRKATDRAGARLRALRLEAGLSLADLARHLDVSYQQIQKYERGTNRLPVDKLAILQRLYGVPYEAFFDRLPPPHPPAPARRPAPGTLERAILADLARVTQPDLKRKIRAIIRILAQ